MRTQHKFRAKPVVYDGIRFASTLEGDFYLLLKEQQASGRIIFFLRQVPFYLAGGVKYVCDFMVFDADGAVKFFDVKGMETPDFKMKKKMVEATYPVEINIVKKGDF